MGGGRDLSCREAWLVTEGTGTTGHLFKKAQTRSLLPLPAFQHISSTELRTRKSTWPSINYIMRTWSGMEEMQETL